MKQLLYSAYSYAGCHRLVWALGTRNLRILSYHGICDDHLAGQPWMPSYFVSSSAFESHLKYLQRHAQVLPLREAVAQLQNGSLPERAVSLTFDDGYANNLRLASPLLKKYGMRATIFVASSYVESGEFFPFLKVKLVKLFSPTLDPKRRVAARLDYKTNPIDLISANIQPCWDEIEVRITEEQRKTLRPLTCGEIAAAGNTFDFGAHTVTHCILKNEVPSRRRDEIKISIEKVAAWAGKDVLLFSYPNGERGDFDESDKRSLRSMGIQAAVTGIAGANRSGCDLLELRRYPVGIKHNEAAFNAELTGFRNLVRSAAMRQGA